jgi:CO dehydrogenase/acetyl-CoA synthase beta subunit
MCVGVSFSTVAMQCSGGVVHTLFVLYIFSGLVSKVWMEEGRGWRRWCSDGSSVVMDIVDRALLL